MQTTVKQFMSGDPVSIEPSATALDAYEAMLRHGIRHLPVVAPDARVIGVVTADDLAAALALPLRPRRALGVGERSAELGEVSLTATLEELATRRLVALDRALDHAAQGRLSRCDRCGGSISLPRLRALPGTTLCIDCARATESS